MHVWFLTPFPTPFPAPSIVELITSNAILLLLLLTLSAIFPSLRRIFWISHTPRLFNSLRFWIAVSLGTSISGLTVLKLGDASLDIRVGLVWSVVYLVVLTLLKKLLLALLRMQPIYQHRP